MQLDLIAMFVAIIGVIVWFVRLEGRVNHLEKYAATCQKDIDGVILKHEALDSKIMDRLGEVEKALARIEGALTILHKEKGSL